MHRDVFIPTTAGKEREVEIMKLISEFWKEEDAVGVVEVILILVGILTPYYGGSIKCIT